MVWLQATLAFAVVMIIFSTLTTSVVEIFHQIIGLRQKVLREIVSRFFDDIIWPRCRIKFQNATAVAEQRLRQEVIQTLVSNPVLSQGSSAKVKKGNFQGMIQGIVRRASVPTDERTLTAPQLLDRLAQTEIGTVLVSEGKDSIDHVLTELIRRFDAMGTSASQYFQARARLVSIIVAIGIAVSVNVDAIRIFKGFIKDPKLAEKFVDQGEASYEKFLEKQESLEKLLQKKISDEEKISESGPANAQLVEIKESINAFGADIAKMTDQGLPIGGNYFPHCRANSPDEDCKKTDLEYGYAFFTWLLRVIATGFLIGLGAPFWYRIFTSLSAVGQAARAIGALRVGKPQYDEAAAKPPKKTPREEKEEETKTAIENFKASVAIAPAGARGRQPLTGDGNVLTEDNI